MAERIVNFSDLSGDMILDQEELVGIIVTDHPDLDQAVRLEAMPKEVEPLGKFAIAGVRLEVTMPGDESSSTYILTAANFNKLATKRPMDEVLAEAKPVVAAAEAQKRRSHNRTTSGEPLRSFDTLESAGLPHQGKIGADEARLVRENLETVNANRVAHGHAPIDPTNPIDAKRFGFEPEQPSNDAE